MDPEWVLNGCSMILERSLMDFGWVLILGGFWIDFDLFCMAVHRFWMGCDGFGCVMMDFGWI